MGGLGVFYPNDPNYVHFENYRDIIAVGVGSLSLAAHLGKGAVIATY